VTKRYKSIPVLKGTYKEMQIIKIERDFDNFDDLFNKIIIPKLKSKRREGDDFQNWW